MNYYDNEELREMNQLLSNKIRALEKVIKTGENVISAQDKQIKILERIIKYLENWLHNNVPTFDFSQLEKYKQN